MEDLQNRLSKARSTFARLKRIWNPSNILRKTNLKPYKTLMVPDLLRGSKTWKVNKGDDKLVDAF